MNKKPFVASSLETPVSPWPHRLSVVLVCATFPLLWVGALVTTREAGMAVDDWPTTYGYNMFLYPLSWWVSGPWDVFIEHGHRLFGALVGMLTIALMTVLWQRDDRTWMRRLGVIALLLVIGQGVLGGLRVILNDTQVAQIHGCVGPLFFALTVSLAVFTSRWWRTSSSATESPRSNSAVRLALLTAVFAYMQILLGAQIRHINLMASGSLFQMSLVFHLMMVGVLFVHVVLLMRATCRANSNPVLSRPAIVLGVLLVLQIVLGCATWVWKYGWPEAMFGGYRFAANWVNTAGSLSESLIVTSHVAIGSLVFVTAVMIALRSLRLYGRGIAMPSIQSNKMGVML